MNMATADAAQKTYQWLRSTLGAYARTRATPAQIPAGVEPQLLCAFIEAHGLEGLFYRAEDASGQMNEVLALWRTRAMAGLLENLRTLRAAVQLFTLLDAANIKAVAMRGVVLAHRDYASPAERRMRDVDILLTPVSRLAVLHSLALAGHEPREQLRSQDVVHIQGVVVELHWSLLTAKRYRGCVEAEQWLESRSPLDTQDGCLYVLSREYELIGLVLHAFIHHELTIFKQLLDIALFLTQEELDWEWLAAWCSRARVGTMFALTLHLVDELFYLEAKEARRCFPLPASAEKRVQAWIRPFFSQVGLLDYLRLKGNMLYAAETPERIFRQWIGFFSASELRDVRRRYFTRP